jgi:hypothetical protein
MTVSPDDAGPASRSLARASIITPGDWIELDLDPATRHTSTSRAVRQAIVRSRSLAPHAVRLMALLDRTSRHAVDAGAFYCASRVIEHTTDGVLVATVVMQICQSDPGSPPGKARLAVAERCAALSAVIRNDPEWVGIDVGVVTLPFIGPAVRLRIEDGAIIVQYIVPLGGLHRYLLATFTCSCPPYARVMTELFDTMAQSLTLHYA